MKLHLLFLTHVSSPEGRGHRRSTGEHQGLQTEHVHDFTMNHVKLKQFSVAHHKDQH